MTDREMALLIIIIAFIIIHAIVRIIKVWRE